MPARLTELKQVAIVNSLRGCRLFAGLSQPELEDIAAATLVKALEKGDYLFREGDPAQGFYVVQRGAVNVHRVTAAGKEQVIHVFRAGESFAEATLALERYLRLMPAAEDAEVIREHLRSLRERVATLN